jgi:hypothetical protein
MWQWIVVLLFGTGVVTTLLGKAWDWWRSRPRFRYTSGPKLDDGAVFVASISQLHDTSAQIIAASAVVTVSRWYRWVHKAVRPADALKAGIIVGEPLAIIAPDRPVTLTGGSSYELRCRIIKQAVLPKRWQPWSPMTMRAPGRRELRSAIVASGRRTHYTRVRHVQGFLADTP